MRPKRVKLGISWNDIRKEEDIKKEKRKYVPTKISGSLEKTAKKRAVMNTYKERRNH
jgi:hypothetical protein